MQKVIHSSHWGAFRALVADGRVVGVEPFERDPEPAAMLAAMPEMVHGEARVRHPAIRRGWLEGGPERARSRRGDDEFVRVSWDRALDAVAGEMTRIRATHGNAALFAGSYGWSSAGRFHHARSQLHRLMNCFGGFTRQINSYSFAAAQALLPHVVGGLDVLTGPLSSWDGIAEHTDLMLCFGGIPLKNAQVESGGTAEHNAGTWVRRCRTAGVAFVNVSPLRDDLPASAGGEWIAIRPNTDTALMLALCQTLLAEGRHDAAFLDRCCTGFGRFAAYLDGSADGVAKTPEWAAPLTGVEAGTIRALSARLTQGRTMIGMAWALQRADHGEQPYWAAIALAAMLGQIGLPGGGIGFGYGAEAGLGNPRRRIPVPALPVGRHPIDSAIPVARIADMLLNPGAPYSFNGADGHYPDVKLLYWSGGNPFHHHQDVNRLVDAFRRPDTIVANEPWWTATARHADIVLPAATTLERNDIGASSRDRFVMAMHRAIAPVGEARSDYDIFSALAGRLGVAAAFTEGRDEMGWLRHLYDVARQGAAEHGVELPGFDAFWQLGYAEAPAPDAPYTIFAEFRRDPAAHPLATPSGKIELFSERIAGFGYADCPGHPTWLEPVEWLGGAGRFPLHLLSNQPATRLHSQMDAGGASRASKVAGREPVRLNPADAAARGIAAGDVVRIWNARGETLAGAVLSDAVMPGVIQLSTGAWYDPETPQGREKHGNPNVLTLDKGTSQLGQGSIAHTCLVEVARHDGAVPAVTVHRAPPLGEAAD